MDSDLSEAINRLPNDWWKTMSVCAVCSNILKGYVLGLMLSGEIGGKFQTGLYSGFLFEFNNTLIWFTAGHVTQDINIIASTTSVNKFKGRWIDWENTEGADSIPINFKDFNAFSGERFGRDLGMFILSPLIMETLVKNTNSVAFRPKHVLDNQDFQPEGYYLLGFPANLREEKRINQTLINRSTLVCLPIERIPCSPDLPFENLDPVAFYGKIVDYPDSLQTKIEVPGMSGGPIIGIKRDPIKGMDYRLYAIQSRWAPESRLIKAEPILEPIEWLVEIESSSNDDNLQPANRK